MSFVGFAFPFISSGDLVRGVLINVPDVIPPGAHERVEIAFGGNTVDIPEIEVPIA